MKSKEHSDKQAAARVEKMPISTWNDRYTSQFLCGRALLLVLIDTIRAITKVPVRQIAGRHLTRLGGE
jgi:hypothetical protein